MAQKFTAKDLDKLQAEGKIQSWKFVDGRDEKAVQRSKYGNKKVEIDGIVFDSQREGNVYIQLRYRQMAGEIINLKLQVPFELNEGGTHSLKYFADFTYTEVKTGEYVVADAKGARTAVYKKKRKLMLKVHRIKILEL